MDIYTILIIITTILLILIFVNKNILEHFSVKAYGVLNDVNKFIEFEKLDTFKMDDYNINNNKNYKFSDFSTCRENSVINFLKPRDNLFIKTDKKEDIFIPCTDDDSKKEDAIRTKLTEIFYSLLKQNELFKDIIILELISYEINNDEKLYKLIINISKLKDNFPIYGRVAVIIQNNIIQSINNIPIYTNDRDIKIFKPYDDKDIYLRTLNDLHLFWPYKTSGKDYKIED